MSTKIVINRKSEWLNRVRGFNLFLDGNEMGKIANGGSVEYTVEPGLHKLQCTIDWCSSPELSIDVNEGETKFLKTGSGMKYYSIAFILIFLSFGFGIILNLMKIEMPADSSTIKLLILVPVLLYITYYLTLGRKKYILLEEDKDNIFN